VSIRADIRQMSLPGWMIYAIDRTFDAISGGRLRLTVADFYLQPLGPIARVPSVTDESIRVGPISREEADPAQMARRAEVLDDRFGSGSTCIAAMRGEEIQGFMWLHFSPLHDKDLRLVLAAADDTGLAWDYDMFIQPKYRLGRTFSRLWEAAQLELIRKGRRGTLSWIRIENGASRRAHIRLGATRVGRAVMLAVSQWQITISSMRPWISVSRPGRPGSLFVRE